MKKTYINPTTDVIEIEVRQMLAASLGVGSGNQDPINADSRMDEELDDFLLGGGDITKLLGM